MKKLRIVAVMVFVILSIFIVGCGKETTKKDVDINAQEEVIKVGFIGPLTGDVAKVGIPVSKGIQLAEKELKASGKNIEVIYEDGRCNGKDALNAYTKLKSVDNVKAIITVCSPELLSIAPVAKADNVLVISPSATAPTITDAGDHVFRLAPSDALQGKVAADLIRKKNYNKVGVIYVNHDYGVGLNNVLKQELGSKVVASEAFEQESSDFRTQLTKLKSANVDVLYVVAFPKDASLILKQKTELGFDAKVIGAEAAKDAEIIPYADESLTITVPSAEGSTYQTFAAKYNGEFGEEPKVYSGEAYDTMNVVSLAIDAARKTNTDNIDVVKGMTAVPNYNGVAGSVTFDNYGDVTKPYDMFTVENGEFVKTS